MLTDDSTNKYIDKIVKRYYKLFGLPSQSKLVIYLGLLSLHGGLLAILPLDFSLDNLILGLSFGILFLILTLITDIIISRWPMKNDLIFNYRRCSALTFFSSLICLHPPSAAARSERSLHARYPCAHVCAHERGDARPSPVAYAG